MSRVAILRRPKNPVCYYRVEFQVQIEQTPGEHRFSTDSHFAAQPHAHSWQKVRNLPIPRYRNNERVFSPEGRKMNTVLLTGGSGFFGGILKKKLLEQGLSVVN